MGSASNMSAYIDTAFLQPTSNCCKCFFFPVGCAFSNCRRRTLPSNVEYQLFSFIKMIDWGIAEDKEIVHQLNNPFQWSSWTSIFMHEAFSGIL